MGAKHKVVVFDLDDTLYKEIDFLKSAYQEIADYFRDTCGIYGLWGEMLRYYGEKKDVFQEVIDFYKRPVRKDFLLKMYREHKPKITLDADTKYVLDALKNSYGASMGIITDGRLLTQMNKIEALGLNAYFDEEDIIISEVWGHKKPDEYAYALMERLFPDSEYTYVGDNPEKDFKGGNQREWNTVCLLDNGRNIHQQNFNMGEIYLPKYRIKNIRELLNII